LFKYAQEKPKIEWLQEQGNKNTIWGCHSQAEEKGGQDEMCLRQAAKLGPPDHLLEGEQEDQSSLRWIALPGLYEEEAAGSRQERIQE